MSGGANTALYVVTNTATLTAAETAVEGRLTAAGLTVTRLASSAAAPADVNDYSIVVIARGSDVNLVGSGGVGKYALITAPMLWMQNTASGSETATYNHYLVGSTNVSVSTAENQNDVLTVHQSTASLAVGNYQTSATVPSSGGTKQYNWPIASMVSGAVVRMDTSLSNDPVAWTIESCADMRVGTAPNRRAVLAWIGVMLSNPTANGTAILDGFIAWCLAGTPCPRGGLKVRGYVVFQ